MISISPELHKCFADKLGEDRAFKLEADAMEFLAQRPHFKDILDSQEKLDAFFEGMLPRASRPDTV